MDDVSTSNFRRLVELRRIDCLYASSKPQLKQEKLKYKLILDAPDQSCNLH
jgi:hypothetical protein